MRRWVIVCKEDGQYLNGETSGYIESLDKACIFMTRKQAVLAMEEEDTQDIEKVIPVEVTISLVGQKGEKK